MRHTVRHRPVPGVSSTSSPDLPLRRMPKNFPSRTVAVKNGPNSGTGGGKRSARRIFRVAAFGQYWSSRSVKAGFRSIRCSGVSSAWASATAASPADACRRERPSNALEGEGGGVSNSLSRTTFPKSADRTIVSGPESLRSLTSSSIGRFSCRSSGANIVRVTRICSGWRSLPHSRHRRVRGGRRTSDKGCHSPATGAAKSRGGICTVSGTCCMLRAVMFFRCVSFSRLPGRL